MRVQPFLLEKDTVMFNVFYQQFSLTIFKIPRQVSFKGQTEGTMQETKECCDSLIFSEQLSFVLFFCFRYYFVVSKTVFKALRVLPLNSICVK